VSENMKMEKISGQGIVEVTVDGGNFLTSEQLHNLYSSPEAIVVKLRVRDPMK
jgi:hypothetical protein